MIGGFNSTELLADVDWELVGGCPKVFCGFSDITALQNALLARSNLVTYSGPHWSTFGMRDHFEQTLTWLRAALFDEAPITIEPAATWTDDEWFVNQDARDPPQRWVERCGSGHRRGAAALDGALYQGDRFEDVGRGGDPGGLAVAGLDGGDDGSVLAMPIGDGVGEG